VTLDRRLVAVGALALAFLVGGVAQAELWKVTSGPVLAVVCSQFAWALLCFVVALLAARGAVRAGVVWGAATGLALIGSYYLAQWVFDGAHAASSQFLYARGPAWVVGSVVAGGCFGLCGGLVSGARRGATAPALGGALAAFTIGVGPALSSAATGRMTDFLGDLTPRTWAAIVYAGVGLVILVAVWRRCGHRATAVGVGAGVAIAAVGLGVLFWAERSGVLYQTF
jgi:hypothetical protein